ncbi:hypothetical protein [Myxococcus eversor]|uniref:hypothetical protein n=1 Tax=Myxococcus eversor TaxID=2709661 RepID=UPI0013D4B26D|nr:hypothetical protein [Myxococcus eversor]
MSRAAPLVLFMALVAAPLAAASPLGAGQSETPRAEETPLPPVPARTPAREPSRPAPALSEEDREVVENLELLESMDAAEDLELLMELSQQD